MDSLLFFLNYNILVSYSQITSLSEVLTCVCNGLMQFFFAKVNGRWRRFVRPNNTWKTTDISSKKAARLQLPSNWFDVNSEKDCLIYCYIRRAAGRCAVVSEWRKIFFIFKLVSFLHKWQTFCLKRLKSKGKKRVRGRGVLKSLIDDMRIIFHNDGGDDDGDVFKANDDDTDDDGGDSDSDDEF